MARQYKKCLGVSVEITFRDTNKFTLSGQKQDVEKAAHFTFEHNLGVLEEIFHDNELNESYAYFNC